MDYFDFNNLLGSLDVIRTTEKRKQQEWTNRHHMMKQSIILHPQVKVNIKNSHSFWDTVHSSFLPVFYNFIYVIIKGTSASKRISVSNANECQHDQNTTEAPLNPDIGDMWPIMSRCAMAFVIILPALFIIIFLLRALLLSNGWNKLHHFPSMA